MNIHLIFSLLIPTQNYLLTSDNVSVPLCVIFMVISIIIEEKVMHSILKLKKKKLNSIVWVRERTIPTKRPPLVSEVIDNFCG
jgi:hypothetical protein